MANEWSEPGSKSGQTHSHADGVLFMLCGGGGVSWLLGWSVGFYFLPTLEIE